MKKRIISTLLTISMLFTMLPLGVLAENEIDSITQTYIVVFNANGDNVADMPEPQIVEEGKTASIPYNPVRDGYVFLGWYLNPEEIDLKQMFNFAETPIYDNIILYAMWGDLDEDADNDGLPDSIETQLGTNIGSNDTDGDGLNDYIEAITLGTNPLLVDTDNNGINDSEEDCDGDSISNIDEISLGTNPGNADSDFDGLSDNDELTIGSDPTNKDTDGDGASDGIEVKHNYDPLVADDSFIDIATSQPISADFPVSASVEAEVSAPVMGSVVINPLTYSDNPLISSTIPGYLGNAFQFFANGDVNSAVLIFEYDTTIWQLSDIFQPRIYQFNETTQALDELDNQTVTEGSVSVSVESCGTYILINKYEYNVIKGNFEVATFRSVNLNSNAVTTSTTSYSDYYATYAEELRALVNNGDTADINNDGIYDKYNIYICLGLIPTTTGAPAFVGYDFCESADYDGDGVTNGEEIKIVINNGLPQIEIISDPTLIDSDFDGLDDLAERSLVHSSDPLRHSYDYYVVHDLLDDDLYSASRLVHQIETSYGKTLASYFLSVISTPVNGTVEDIFKKEWLTYLKQYYDDVEESSMENSAAKYEREFYMNTANGLQSFIQNEAVAECMSYTDDEIRELITAQSIKHLDTTVRYEYFFDLLDLQDQLKGTMELPYFHGLSDGGDFIESSVVANRLESISTKIIECNSNISEIDVEIKRVENFGNTVSTVMDIIDLLTLVESELTDFRETAALIGKINANLEAYSSSRELFWYISQNCSIDYARKPASELYYALEDDEYMLALEYDAAIDSFEQVAAQTGIQFALGKILTNYNIVLTIFNIVYNVAATTSNKNNVIIANDILCDAVEHFANLRLDQVGLSYSPLSQDEKVITDRYLANLMQLRLVGEMKYNNYIPSQENFDSFVEKIKGYSSKLDVPVSQTLLLQCALTVTPNVKGSISIGRSLLDPIPDYGTGDNSLIYKISYDGYTVNYHNAEFKVKLDEGAHELCFSVSDNSIKPCYYYLDIVDEEHYDLDIVLVLGNDTDRTITGYSRIGGLGSTLGNVTVKFREGLNNKNGDVITTVTTNDNGKYSITLPNGYYTAEFSKEGYDTGYTNLSIYQNEDDCSCEIFASTPSEPSDPSEPSNHYYITYNANGGTGAPASYENTAGVTKLSTTIPTRTGHTFLGWDENPNAKEPTYRKKNDGSAITIDKEGNVTLYAIWKAESFDIVFHANGGKFADNSDTYTMQKTYLKSFTVNPEIPTRDGYVFSGIWTLDSDDNVVHLTQGETKTDIDGKAGLHTRHFYAQWTKNETHAQFRYDYNNCSDYDDLTLPLTNGILSVKLVDPPQNILDKFAAAGKKFVKWMYYKPDGSTEYYNSGDTLTITNPGEPRECVYAIWEVASSGALLSVLTDKTSYLPGDTATLTITADNTGYFTVDASNNSGFKIKCADGSTASSGVFVEKSSASTSNTLKCYDNGSAYTVKVYIPNNCSDGSYTVDIVASNGTYGVSGTETSKITETITINVNTYEEEADSYTLLYHPNGGYGTVPDAERFKDGDRIKISAPSGLNRDGYTFSHWTTDEDGDGKEYKAGKTYRFTDDVILYAQWKVDPDADVSKELEMTLWTANSHGKTGVHWYKPGDVIGLGVDIDNSNHFYVSVQEHSGWTLLHANGTTDVQSVFYEKNSPNYDGNQTYTNGSGTIVSIQIPKNCRDGEYTIFVTGADSVVDPSTGSSNGKKLTVGITITVRKSEKPDEVLLNKSEITIHKGDRKRLTAAIVPEFVIDDGYDIKWKSSNTSVATVDKTGEWVNVKSVGIGTATITATCNGISASCKVTVVKCSHTVKDPQDEYLVSPATCATQATYYYVCECGDPGTSTYKYGDVKAHSYSTWTTVKQPTATSAGVEQRTCSGCQNTEERSIPATGAHTTHTPGTAWHSDSEKHWHVCSVDDCNIKLNEGAHTFGDLSVETPATETNTGIGYRTCTCGYSKSEVIPIIKYPVFIVQDAVVTSGDTVQITIELQNSPGISGLYLRLLHSDGFVFSSTISYQNSLECTVMKDDSNPNLIHIFMISDIVSESVYSDGVLVIFEYKISDNVPNGEYNFAITYQEAIDGNDDDIDCQAQNGVITIKSHNHTFSEWTKYDENQHVRTCECGEKEYKNHAWDNGVITTPAMPGQDGVKTYTCSDCKATYTDVIRVYSITFNTDGGTFIETIFQTSGTAVTAPAAPTKEGYTFAGWDKEIPATMPAENVTITALWTPNTYTVTWSVDGNEYKKAAVVYGNAITLPEAPTKAQSGCTAYTFAGWTGYTDGMTMPAANQTFTAEFTESASHTSDKFIYINNSNSTHIKKYECCGNVVNAAEACSDLEGDKDHLCDNCKSEGISNHTGGTATCMAVAICKECDMPYGDKNPENHTKQNTTVKDAVTAECGKAGYTGDTYCECGGKIATGTSINATGEHFDGDDKNHDCDNCTATNVDGGCHGGTATCKTLAVCSECGTAYGALDPTKHESVEITYDDIQNTTHDEYYACCNALKLDNAAHNYVEHMCACGAAKSMSVIFMNGDVQYFKCEVKYNFALDIAYLAAPETSKGYAFAGWYTENGVRIEQGTLITESIVAYAKFIAGDADGNGKIEKKDADNILKYIVGQSVPVNDTTALDVNRDGKVTVVDAVTILLYLAGKVDLIN